MTERLDRVEADLAEVQATLRRISQMQEYDRASFSELRSAVSTLAEIVGIHDRQFEELGRRWDESRQRHDAQIQRLDESQQLHDDQIQRLIEIQRESQQRHDARMQELAQIQRDAQQRFEESRQQHDARMQELDRIQRDAQQRFEESQQRFDRYVERSEQDRALMLQLITAIAQRG